MSGAMVKWRPGLPAKLSPEEQQRVISEALELLRRPLPAPRSHSANLAAAGEIADLQRICAVHAMPYAARYIRCADGRFRHAQTIRVTQALYLGQYAENGVRCLVPSEDIIDETCPWCGASGFGAVLCSRCHTEVCYGRTTGSFVRCYCGHQGHMISEFRSNEGVSPRLVRGGTRRT